MTDAPAETRTCDLYGAALVERLRRLEPFLRLEGIAACALFGSRARGDHRPDSDIDLLVTPASDPQFSMLNLSRVGLLIKTRLGLEANLVPDPGAESRFRSMIAGDLMPVFE